MTDDTETPQQPPEPNEHLSTEEAVQKIQELLVEHDFDTSVDDQDEP